MERESLRIFFVISGEHPTLPRAELIAILDAKSATYKVIASDYKLVEIEASRVTPNEVAGRAGFTEEAGLKIFKSCHLPSCLTKIAPPSSLISDPQRIFDRSGYDGLECLPHRATRYTPASVGPA